MHRITPIVIALLNISCDYCNSSVLYNHQTQLESHWSGNQPIGNQNEDPRAENQNEDPRAENGGIPTYLGLIYNELLESVTEGHLYETQSQEKGQRQGHLPILRSIRPDFINYEDFGVSRLYFNISSFLGTGLPNSVQLILRLMEDDVRMFLNSHVTLHIKLQNDELQSQKILSHVEFYGFDVTEFCKESLENRIFGIHFAILVSRNNRRKDIPLSLLFHTDSPDAPFLLFQYAPLPISIPIINNHRNKRSIQNNIIGNLEKIQRNSDSPYCKREEWLVRPGDIGLDDVIAPQFIDIGYCSGECPFPLINEDFNYTLHSYFVDRHRIIRGFQVPESLPSARCVGVSYKPLMVVEGSILDSSQSVSIHKDALLGSCGCSY